MDYRVRRGEQEFGPYTLAELQQYAGSGNVLMDDLTKNEAMEDWVPVSQVLGTIPAPVSFTVNTPQEVPLPTVPLPWNLHWGIVLLLVIVTRQVFNFLWVFVLANWARKLSGNNKALVLVAMYPGAFVAMFLIGVLSAVLGAGQTLIDTMVPLLILVGAVTYVWGIFTIRAAMEEYYNSTEKIGLQLSGAMTFFFGTIYIQFHVNKLHRWKKTGIYL